MIVAFWAQILVWLDWRRNFFKKRWFLIFVVPTRLFGKAICSITTKQHNCRFLILKKQYPSRGCTFCIADIRTAFTILFPCLDMLTLLSWTISARTIDISNNTLNWFLRPFNNIYISLGYKSRITNLFVLRRECYRPDVWTFFEDIDIHFCRKIEKSFCACKLSQYTFFSDSTRSQ